MIFGEQAPPAALKTSEGVASHQKLSAERQRKGYVRALERIRLRKG